MEQDGVKITAPVEDFFFLGGGGGSSLCSDVETFIILF